MEMIKGTLQSVIFANKSFAIISIMMEDNNTMVVKGEYPNPNRDIGLIIEIMGEYVNDKKYGRQFKAASVRTLAADDDGLYYFLTRIVGHVPKKTAREMSDRFSDEEFETLMKSNPRRLLGFKGIGEKKLGKIVKAWKKFEKTKQLAELLSPHGVSRTLIIKIFEHFGESADAEVRKNPYVLTQIDGIGFRRADEVSLKIGIRPDSTFRLLSALVFVLNESAHKHGHTVHEAQDIFVEMSHAVALEGDSETPPYFLTDQRFDEVFEKAVGDGEIQEVAPGRYALPKYAKMEGYIYERLSSEMNRGAMPLVSDHEALEFIQGIERKTGFTFSEEQKEAVLFGARGFRVFGIAGYAGCGKTTISLAAIRLISKYAGGNITCCALSGVAAKRIETVTGFTGRTIHSLIGLNTDEERDEDFPLTEDLIVLDEASMVDTFIFYRLLKAIDFDRTRLIIIGDPGQLPPVGAGAPYTDILENHLIPRVILTKIYRQREDQSLVSMSESIRHGHLPKEIAISKGNKHAYADIYVKDFSPSNYQQITGGMSATAKKAFRQQIESSALEHIKLIAGAAKPSIEEMKESGEWVALTTFFQIAAPMKKGGLGIAVINTAIADILNPPSETMASITAPLSKKTIRKGDKVIHLKNRNKEVILPSYERTEKRVFNGQIGFVETINAEEGEFTVFYPNEDYVTLYEVSNIDEGELDLAYALSIHKTQGQEAQFFVLAVSRAHTQMLNAKLLYTGVTRAKKRIYIVGEIPAFERGCRTLDDTNRRTVLDSLCKKEDVKVDFLPTYMI